MKKFMLVIAVVGLLVKTVVGANVTSSDISNPAVEVNPKSTTAVVLPGIWCLTNHAELVGAVFKKVQGVMVTFTPDGGTHGGPVSSFWPYVSPVKSLEEIAGMVTNTWYGLPIVDTNAQINITVQFYDSPDESTVRGYNQNVTSQVLFQGYGGGTPVRSQYGNWGLPDWAQQISMYINGNVYVTLTNVVYAHLLETNKWGGYVSTDLKVDWQKGFWFEPDYAGAGILVIGSYVYTSGGGVYYTEKAYDLNNAAVPVPIQTVWVRAMLEDSDDFKSSVDLEKLVYTVYSNQGYGKVPLLTPTYTKSTAVYMSLGDQLGNYATSYVVENQTTGERTTVNVPVGQSGVTVVIPKGVYHIIPYGLNLKPMSLYWSWTMSTTMGAQN